MASKVMLGQKLGLRPRRTRRVASSSSAIPEAQTKPVKGGGGWTLEGQEQLDQFRLMLSFYR